MAEDNWHFQVNSCANPCVWCLIFGIPFNPNSDRGCGNSKFRLHPDQLNQKLRVGSRHWYFWKVLQSILICRQSFKLLPYTRLPLRKCLSETFRSHQYKWWWGWKYTWSEAIGCGHNFVLRQEQVGSSGNNLVNQKYSLSLLPKHKGTWSANSGNTRGTFHKVTQEGSLAWIAFPYNKGEFSCSTQPKSCVQGAKTLRSARTIHHCRGSRFNPGRYCVHFADPTLKGLAIPFIEINRQIFLQEVIGL